MLKEKIEQDLKVALKSREQTATSILRLLLADIHNREIAKGGVLNEEEVLSALSGAVKQHQDSIEQFETAGRTELLRREQAELEIIQSYLPQPFSEEELRAIIAQTLAEVPAGLRGPKDFGKVMQKLMPKVKGRADGAAVSQIVREELGKNAS